MIALARAKAWPARIIAASAFSRSFGSRRGVTANGPSRRRSAKRNAAAPPLRRRVRARHRRRLRQRRRPQLLDQPPFAIAASGKRPRLAQREGRVIDIAEAGEALGDRLEIGLALALPAALAQLAADNRGAWRGSSRSARHSAMPALRARWSRAGGSLRAVAGAMTPFLCHTPCQGESGCRDAARLI